MTLSKNDLENNKRVLKEMDRDQLIGIVGSIAVEIPGKLQKVRRVTGMLLDGSSVPLPDDFKAIDIMQSPLPLKSVHARQEVETSMTDEELRTLVLSLTAGI